MMSSGMSLPTDDPGAPRTTTWCILPAAIVLAVALAAAARLGHGLAPILSGPARHVVWALG